jgi:hypothetical protein
MAVESMTPADVALLSLIVEKDRTTVERKKPYLFKGTKLAALIRDAELRFATADDCEEGSEFFGDAVYTDTRFCVDQVAFG